MRICALQVPEDIGNGWPTVAEVCTLPSRMLSSWRRNPAFDRMHAIDKTVSAIRRLETAGCDRSIGGRKERNRSIARATEREREREREGEINWRLQRTDGSESGSASPRGDRGGTRSQGRARNTTEECGDIDARLRSRNTDRRIVCRRNVRTPFVLSVYGLVHIAPTELNWTRLDRVPTWPCIYR